MTRENYKIKQEAKVKTKHHDRKSQLKLLKIPRSWNKFSICASALHGSITRTGYCTSIYATLLLGGWKRQKCFLFSGRFPHWVACFYTVPLTSHWDGEKNNFPWFWGSSTNTDSLVVWHLGKFSFFTLLARVRLWSWTQQPLSLLKII